ncbi:protein kinase [Dactylosporangium aurantiacum]|uniref:non-specific serine/threonine protein kinase n=2 Tax=Dactylosporangium aurantiacum TaxID=35754 RepID=A0A9Q9ISJ9_9ACTN|nr:serine/threonine-protein kinase [Dactylosporangium aurantiacum]UWZ58605.1 protein kinase [Dactylosporangium aurantiacum]
MSTVGGRYRLMTEVGTGGMASVWRAVDARLDRTVAVKLLRPDLAESPRARERAEIEARAAARLVHPNIAVIHDAGHIRRGLRGRVPYLVMEFVDGETLCQRLSAQGSMPWQRAARITVQIADALAAAHLHRVVHRDIKPGNIILTPSRVKVVDFGLAAFVGVLPAGPAGVLLGTPEYMAPEQIRGEPVTAAADVYALGLVLLQMLTGSLPWTAADRHGLLQQRRRFPHVRMPPVAGVPAAIVALCEQCLSEDPQWRPSSRHIARVVRETLAEHDPDPETVDVSVPMTVHRAARSVATAPASWALPTRQRLRRPSRRTVATAIAILAAIVGWIHPVGSPLTASASDPPTGSGVCAIRYTSHRSSATFTADLAIRGRTQKPWRLQFTAPAGQHVTAVTAVAWSQTGAQVALTGTEPLASGQLVAVTLTGELQQIDAPPPGDFAVNGVICERSVAVFAVAQPDTA